MRIDLQLEGSPDRAADEATQLAATGVDGVFTFEGRHDAFLPLAAATTATGLPIMSNIAVALPRSPLHLAHLAHDLQLLSRGRFTLGLGSQVRTHVERRYGATWSHPAARMRESVAATREILAAWHEERTPQFRGEYTRHDFMPPMFRPEPLPWGPPPVMMGALGPIMTRTAGEVADGLLVMPFNTRAHMLERTLPALREGLERGSRSEGDVAIVPQVIAAMGDTIDERAAAMRGCRSLVAFYASTPAYRPVLEVSGREHLQPRLAGLVREGAVDAMSDLVVDELYDEVAVRGTPEECARLIRDRVAGISDRVCVYFPGYTPSHEAVTRLVTALHGERPSGA
ncbi:TIGR03617 family F420-dependent LLM class oxidoreductase [Nocardioides sp. YIM 152315]|uniref:TIGR03617 family F420-dependent LLM class oxidoreductase n=1 Tax=Nocardioides sp. YIM 152315 TaxID=3031760 RepID=UPI0023DA9FF3|nr:TIGR03617 family F420-dependent LLM class oxidoreductase [Nocardioides sp. YIM 152315]MDF1604703.1 TIGR03617 family F420-dependent LLM class oxidoreductase [Nocardioides sp. YIM 152315]